MANASSSFSVINDVIMTSVLFEGYLYVSQLIDCTYYLSIFCLMCTFREIWIPPIILPMPMISDYLTLSIKSCPEVGDANYIIV